LGCRPRATGHPASIEPPPFKWGDRHDLIGLAVAAALGAALPLADVSPALTIVFGCAALNLTAYAFRRRAGIPQVTLWQRLRHARR
jgi:hypothetical protein